MKKCRQAISRQTPPARPFKRGDRDGNKNWIGHKNKKERNIKILDFNQERGHQ